MKKIMTKVGYTVYQTTRDEVALIGSEGICDNCLAKPERGYLIPVMNRWLCPDCYERWEKGARFYAEDMPIERKNAAFYEANIPLAIQFKACPEIKECTMTLMPAAPGTCPICAHKHEADQPHNQQSLYYQMRFQMENGRGATWEDAMAHCTDEVKALWIAGLAKHGIKVEKQEGTKL